MVVGVDAGLAAFDGDAAMRTRAGHVCGEVQKEEFIPRGGTVRCVVMSLEGQGPTARIFLSPVQFIANLVLSTLASVRLSRLGE